MRRRNGTSSRCRGIFFASLFMAAAPGCKDAPPGSISVEPSLSVEPSVVRLTDRIYPANQYVSAKFRIVNSGDKPVKLTEMATSCGCTTAMIDGGKEVPVIVSPKGSLEFRLSAFGTPRPEPLQSFIVNLSSECEGRPLPDVRATLQFQVEDPVRVIPPGIVVAGLPSGPFKRSVSLVTRSASTMVPKLELMVSDTESIGAALNRPAPGMAEVPGFQTHYTVDVTVTPRPGESTVTGIISVKAGDLAIQAIPVECTFKTPFSLSLKEIHVDGSPGDQVGKEIYYEAHDPEWRDVAVTHRPDNIGVETAQFDQRTQRLRFTIKIPSGELPADDECVILKSKRGGHEIKLPVRYQFTRVTR